MILCKLIKKEFVGDSDCRRSLTQSMSLCPGPSATRQGYLFLTVKIDTQSEKLAISGILFFLDKSIQLLICDPEWLHGD